MYDGLIVFFIMVFFACLIYLFAYWQDYKAYRTVIKLRADVDKWVKEWYD